MSFEHQSGRNPPGALCEADARTRTADPFITSEVLYQLSYVGAGLIVAAHGKERKRTDNPCAGAVNGPVSTHASFPESVGFRYQTSLRPGSHVDRADVYTIWDPTVAE